MDYMRGGGGGLNFCVHGFPLRFCSDRVVNCTRTRQLNKKLAATNISPPRFRAVGGGVEVIAHFHRFNPVEQAHFQKYCGMSW